VFLKYACGVSNLNLYSFSLVLCRFFFCVYVLVEGRSAALWYISCAHGYRKWRK
jgi:hypothetical protein